MHLPTILLLSVAISVSGLAADAEAERVEAARKLVHDYDLAQRARAAAEDVAARRLIDDHESGKKKASDDELFAAREIAQRNKADREAQIERAIDATPVLMVLYRDTPVAAGPILDAANREFMRRRIAEIQSYIEGNDQGSTARLRQELRSWEKGLAELKPNGKPLGGLGVTVFEEPDRFVVAYFENSRWEHFVCALRKSDYSLISPAEDRSRKAIDAAQKSIIVH